MVLIGSKFIYLVQTAGLLPEVYKYLDKNNSDLLTITWKDKVDGVPFYPGSTWTEGRNHLYEMAKVKKGEYLYFIFLDDDLPLTKEKIKLFEELLVEYRPAIASPRLWSYNENCEDLSQHVHSVYAFDAAMNAFHYSVIYDDVLFPYTADFDSESWWYSQLIMLQKAHVFYDGFVLQFNEVHLSNATHSSYPRNNDFYKIEEWLNNNVIERDIKLLRHPDETRSVQVCEPIPPLNTYKVSSERKRKLLRNYE